ncbi:hypothetical protein [Streptomyces sp. LN785]|uniref:hypothetical protein n=1 Tax=Streptomyces sp. LN785 TaxID=3112983 RepID=UPI00372181F3
MTILTHAEARRTPSLPAPISTSYVFGADDDVDDVVAVVAVKVAMTRDMLAVALDLASVGRFDENPDAWTVEWIRESVEIQLCIEGPFTIQRDAEGFADMALDPTVGNRVRAEYRAIDRAYPHLAPKENV